MDRLCGARPDPAGHREQYVVPASNRSPGNGHFDGVVAGVVGRAAGLDVGAPLRPNVVVCPANVKPCEVVTVRSAGVGRDLGVRSQFGLGYAVIPVLGRRDGVVNQVTAVDHWVPESRAARSVREERLVRRRTPAADMVRRNGAVSNQALVRVDDLIENLGVAVNLAGRGAAYGVANRGEVPVMVKPAQELKVVARVVVALAGAVLRFRSGPHAQVVVVSSAVRPMQPDADPHSRVDRHAVGEVKPVLQEVSAIGLRHPEHGIDVPARQLDDVDAIRLVSVGVIRGEVVLNRADAPDCVRTRVLVVLASVTRSVMRGAAREVLHPLGDRLDHPLSVDAQVSAPVELHRVVDGNLALASRIVCDLGRGYRVVRDLRSAYSVVSDLCLGDCVVRHLAGGNGIA